MFVFIFVFVERECKFSSVMQVANRGEGKVPATDYHVEPPEQNCPRTLTLYFSDSGIWYFSSLFLVFLALVFLQLLLYLCIFAFIRVFIDC